MEERSRHGKTVGNRRGSERERRERAKGHEFKSNRERRKRGTMRCFSWSRRRRRPLPWRGIGGTPRAPRRRERATQRVSSRSGSGI